MNSDIQAQESAGPPPETSYPDHYFGPQLCTNLEIMLEREWLVANGIGGYASATLAGANTRRYHGLLVAALRPPLGRAVLLSKLEETLQAVSLENGETMTRPLSTNLYPDAVHPSGYEQLESWSALPMPTWVWSPWPGYRFEKQVWMAGGENTTYISYCLLEAPAGHSVRLDLVPLLAWKDYHTEMKAYPGLLDTAWSSSDPATLRVTLPGATNVLARPLVLRLQVRFENGDPFSNAWFVGEPDWYRRFQHPRERERGMEFEEDLYTPGTLSALLRVNEPLVIVASTESTEPASPRESRLELKERQHRLCAGIDPQDCFAQSMALSADPFVVHAPGGRSSVIAGYPWFSDRGREAMIALPGLCLCTGQASMANQILRSFAGAMKNGLLPGRFSEQEETPIYDSADAALWFVQALWCYIEFAHDGLPLARECWPVLQSMIESLDQGETPGIRIDEADGLLQADVPEQALTWMDAKVGDWIVTPRAGKPVELNALWYNALCIFEQIAQSLALPFSEYSRRARRVGRTFRSAFVRTDGQGLCDVITKAGQDRAIRPNQIFAVSLPFSPLTRAEQKAVVQTVQEHLLTPVGLRTLSPQDSEYRAHYGGSQWDRDAAYHQGSVWPWLLGPYAEAHHRVYGRPVEALELLSPLLERLDELGIGWPAELYDGEAPHRPHGCIARACTTAELLRVWTKLKREEG